MNDHLYNIKKVVFNYWDHSGSFKNLPRLGDIFENDLGRFVIREVRPLSKYTDGGASPFEVEVVCSRILTTS